MKLSQVGRRLRQETGCYITEEAMDDIIQKGVRVVRGQRFEANGLI